MTFYEKLPVLISLEFKYLRQPSKMKKGIDSIYLLKQRILKSMKMRIAIIAVLIAMGGLMTSALQPKVVDDKDKERLILYAVMEFIEQLHIKNIEIDDDFSKQVYDVYLKRLDGGKRFLTIEDLDLMDDYQQQIDDQIENGDLEFFDLSLDLIQKGVLKVKEFYPEILNEPFDFSKPEMFESDGQKREYAKDDIELRRVWEKYLKYEVLTRIVDDLAAQEEEEDPEGGKKTISELEAEAREDVKELFDDWFSRLEKLRRSDRFEMYINSITNVFDPHTDYFNPKEKQDFDINMSNRLEGIGARLSSEGEYTKVVMIVPGGPAWKQGQLEVDDLIHKVEQDNEDALDVTGMHLDDVVSKIRGKKGTKVTLHVKKADGEMVSIPIIREEVVLDEGLVKSAVIDFPGKIDRVGYIKLPRFYADFDNPEGNSCYEDMAIELEKLKEQKVNGIILDLRNNGGGSLNDVVKMSGLFIDRGPVVQVKDRRRPAYVYRDKDPEVQYDGPLIVMVNKRSASASEILAAALQDYGRAVIVGSTSTFGKGTVQRFFNLDKGISGYEDVKPLGNLKMTIQKFYRVDGGSTQLKGVTPDIVLPDNTHYTAIGEQRLDNPLEWTQIENVDYKRNSEFAKLLDQLKYNSNNRIKENETFTKIDENAMRLKRNRESSVFPLNLDEYRLLVQEREEEAKKYRKMFPKIEGLQVQNLEVDLPYIQQDSVRIGQNEDFLKNVKKDVYLDESLNILRDLIAISEPKVKGS